MKNKIFILIIIILLIIIGVSVYKKPIPPAEIVTENPPAKQYPVYKDLIKVTNLSAGDIIKSPYVLKGEARGNWYFEASFPVKVLDENNNVLFQGPAQAIGDWMTTEYVPFEITLTFQPGTSKTGTLVLENDNPSGDPARQETFEISVKF